LIIRGISREPPIVVRSGCARVEAILLRCNTGLCVSSKVQCRSVILDDHSEMQKQKGNDGFLNISDRFSLVFQPFALGM
jgi:hypothetical protein